MSSTSCLRSKDFALHPLCSAADGTKTGVKLTLVYKPKKKDQNGVFPIVILKLKRNKTSNLFTLG